MKVSLSGMFGGIKADLRGKYADMYRFTLDELEQHLRELVAGKHTVADFAEYYCLNEAPSPSPTQHMKG